MTEPAEYPRDDVARDGYVTGGAVTGGALDDVPLTVEESLDSDDLGDTDAGLDPLDDSWDAPDRPSAETRLRPTATESLAGGSLEEHLAQEVPDVDPYEEAERAESGSVLDDDVTLPEEETDSADGSDDGPADVAEASLDGGRNQAGRNAPGNVAGFGDTAGNDERARGGPVTLVVADDGPADGMTAHIAEDRADHSSWPPAPEEAALHLVE